MSNQADLIWYNYTISKRLKTPSLSRVWRPNPYGAIIIPILPDLISNINLRPKNAETFTCKRFESRTLYPNYWTIDEENINLRPKNAETFTCKGFESRTLHPNYWTIDEENINNRDFRDIATALAPRKLCEAKRNGCSIATFIAVFISVDHSRDVA